MQTAHALPRKRFSADSEFHRPYLLKLEIAFDYFYPESHRTVFLQLLLEVSSMRLAVFLRWPRRKSSRTAAKLPPLRIRINNRRNGFLEFFKPLADVWRFATGEIPTVLVLGESPLLGLFARRLAAVVATAAELRDSNDSNVPPPGFSFPARHRWPDLNRKTR